MVNGIPVSNGVGLAKALIITKKALDFSKEVIESKNVPMELERLGQAITLSHKQLETLYKSAKQRLGSEAEIIQAQMAMLNDPVMVEEIKNNIANRFLNAEYSVELAFDEQISILAAIDDDYIRERAADLSDIKIRLLHTLTGNPIEMCIDEESILVCDILTPTQTANLSPKYVKGIICESGGATSHAAILARSLGIPAIVGCKGCTDIFVKDDIVFVNGSKGEAFVVTEESEKERLRKDIESAIVAKAELLAMKDAPGITKDGKTIALYTNMGTLDEVKLLEQYGSDGIGLFRTEFLYMEGKSAPSEQAQFTIYKKIVEELDGKNVVFRTLDIGGDKDVPYLKIPKEDNPFLGWRAIRICLEEKQLFKTQLRALLRASAFGSLKIMVPMISSIMELREAREIFENVKAELRQESITFDEQTKFGIMVEIPSAALCADFLIKEADFFSIGTNDLTQYTLAVDRGNEKVSSYYDFFNPAVLRLVKMTIEASHKANKTTSMCGEAAGDPVATMLLLGLGLDSFSISPSILPKIKKIISHIDIKFAEDVACIAMTMETGDEINQFLMSKLEDIGLGYLVLL